VEPRTLVGLAVFGGLVLALSASAISGWFFGAVVAATLVLAIPLSIRRLRVERNLARMVWRALTPR
jgi:hypothetical protein